MNIWCKIFGHKPFTSIIRDYGVFTKIKKGRYYTESKLTRCRRCGEKL